MIERFIDVSSLERSLSRSLRRGYRADLVGLDGWMQRRRGRTLVNARPSDLRIYLDERRMAGVDGRLMRRLVMSLQHFYAYLCECGCREDDAARRIAPVIPEQAAHLQACSQPRLSAAEG